MACCSSGTAGAERNVATMGGYRARYPALCPQHRPDPAHHAGRKPTEATAWPKPSCEPSNAFTPGSALDPTLKPRSNNSRSGSITIIPCIRIARSATDHRASLSIAQPARTRQTLGGNNIDGVKISWGVFDRGGSGNLDSGRSGGGYLIHCSRYFGLCGPRRRWPTARFYPNPSARRRLFLSCMGLPFYMTVRPGSHGR